MVHGKLIHTIFDITIIGAGVVGLAIVEDLAGRVRFGPDTEYVTNLAYAVDETKRNAFWKSLKRYLPGVRRERLQPDTSGIRPKLQGPGDPYRDFVIAEESGRGCPGLINLIGIESPGLTAYIPMARYVARLVRPC